MTERNKLGEEGIDAETLKCSSKYKLFTGFNCLRRGHTRGPDYTQ